MTHQPDAVDPLRLAFICVDNAGRSQIAAAIAETQVRIQGRTDLEILSGGTDPTEKIYPAVVDVMQAEGYDLSSRTPTRIFRGTLTECDVDVDAVNVERVGIDGSQPLPKDVELGIGTVVELDRLVRSLADREELERHRLFAPERS